MIQGTAKLNVMKSDIESELSVTDYISGFSVCDELAIKVKKRNKNKRFWIANSIFYLY